MGYIKSPGDLKAQLKKGQGSGGGTEGGVCVAHLMVAQLSLSSLGAKVEMELECGNPGDGNALFDQRLSYFLTTGPKSWHRYSLCSDTGGGGRGVER